MSAKSSIEWTDATWNPIRGCSRVSEGCRHCYAERVAARFSGPGQPYEGLALMRSDGPHWTGKVRLVEEALELPLRWKKPRRIFVNSMSDLFHEGLTDYEIGLVFDVMVQAKRHVFQVLTKRPERMRNFVNSHWPVEESHIWLGTSVEDQETAEARIPFLLDTKAAVHWISAEPLLGPINFNSITPLDWVVVGGESGPRARPMHPEWARSVRDQCKGAGVPFFFKQWGEWGPELLPWRRNHPKLRMLRKGKKAAGRLLDGQEWNEYPGDRAGGQESVVGS